MTALSRLMLWIVLFSFLSETRAASRNLYAGNPTDNIKLHLVYMLFVDRENDHWEKLVSGQLAHVKACGLTDALTSSHVHISLGGLITATRNDKGEDNFIEERRPSDAEMGLMLQRASGIVKRFLPDASIAYKLKNQYEYQGIKAAWTLGQNFTAEEAHNNAVLYFHAKCMWNRLGVEADGRCDMDKLMFKYVIEPWRNVTQAFRGHPNLNKAGIGISPSGVVWGNFWWARASYLRELETPKLMLNDRMYYEQWMGSSRHGGSDGLTLCPPGLPIGEAYESGYGPKNTSVMIPCWAYDPFPNYNPYLIGGLWNGSLIDWNRRIK